MTRRYNQLSRQTHPDRWRASWIYGKFDEQRRTQFYKEPSMALKNLTLALGLALTSFSLAAAQTATGNPNLHTNQDPFHSNITTGRVTNSTNITNNTNLKPKSANPLQSNIHTGGNITNDFGAKKKK
jgi:hypothetical protein